MTHTEATGGYVKEIGRVLGWDMSIFEPNLFPYKYSNIFEPVNYLKKCSELKWSEV